MDIYEERRFFSEGRQMPTERGTMLRRVLLVDDEVAVLLTMKAILEISGFDVDTAASARDGKLKLRSHEYDMIITDMRMESDAAGAEVIRAARNAGNHPAVALLTAYPVDEADWQQMGAHKLLLKPVHTRLLLEQIEQLFLSREKRLAGLVAAAANGPVAKVAAKKVAAKKVAAKKAVVKKKAVKVAAVKAKAKRPTAPVRALKKAAKKAAKKR
jgi:DNA-binding response OmpR family regulator